MSRSEPKPKIVYRNLEEVIQKNANKRNVGTLKHNSCSSRQRLPLNQISNKKLQKNSSQKKKIHFINKNQQPCSQTQSTSQFYSHIFNEIDVIFTQLQDHILSSKQRVLKEIRNTLKQGINLLQSRQKVAGKVQQVNKMSEYIKHIANYFIQNEIPSIDVQPTCLQFQNSYENNPKTKIHTLGSCPQNKFYENIEDSSKVLQLSMKNSKVRANRRSQALVNRKKTVYEMILDERENRGRIHTQQSVRK